MVVDDDMERVLSDDGDRSGLLVLRLKFLLLVNANRLESRLLLSEPAVSSSLKRTKAKSILSFVVFGCQKILKKGHEKNV